MRAIWKGSISFGLVNIPISLFAATKTEDLKFRLLRGSDLSPVNYKRVAEKDGKEVPWEEIVKGYEYDKGKFVILKEEDFKRVDIEATQTVEIEAFVAQEEINPIFFSKPYYMEPQKGADRAYVLLREALRASGKIGIAKVAIKTRDHLAAVKPQDDGLMLVLMYWAAELREVDEFKSPKESQPTRKELGMAQDLIESMVQKWDPEAYKDEYREALEEVIEEKIAKGGKSAPKKTVSRKRATNVIDLVAVLEQSLRDTSGKKSPTKKTPSKKAATKKTTRKATTKKKGRSPSASSKTKGRKSDQAA